MSDAQALELSKTRPAKRARRTSADRLRDAILALSDHRAQVIAQSERSWASITFAGARHVFTLIFVGEEAVEAGERFVANLPEHEFALSGHLVADATVSEVEHRMVPSPRMIVTCEVLMLEEG